MDNQTNIPPRCAGRQYRSELMEQLRGLKNIGDKIVVPKEKRCMSYVYARRLGIEVTTRNLGSDSDVFVYRTK